MSYTHVDKPFRIRNVELKNRIVRSAHGTNIGGGLVTDDFIAYHEARARGGVGLTIVELVAVHPSSAGLFNIWTPGLADGMKRLVDACKPYGMKLFQQIWHGGIQGKNIDGGPPWSCSDIASSKIGVVPVPMTQGMIDEVIGAYADTARQCEEWGLDGVEVHCAHSYLPHQFLSEAWNKRTDQYGGSFENRARFMVDTVAAVRSAVTDDFVVGVRVSPDYQVGSLGPDDVLRAVLMLEDRDLIDFVDLSAGNYQTDHKMIGGMHEPVGYEMVTSAPVTTKVKSATIVTGRIRTLDDADLIIREGEADLVVITRGTIADPDLVSKSLAGRGTDVRPCIGCNQGCVGGIMKAVFGGPSQMACTVNPAVGFEATLSEEKLAKVTTPKTILVIGGGVAGMEAARVAALRGHKVILAEAGSDLGGLANIAAMAPTRHAIHDIVVWQQNQLFTLGVDVRLSTYLEADDIDQFGADEVIIATGSLPRGDGILVANPGEPILGVERPHVISSVDLFTDSRRDLGSSAVVVDDVGHYEGMAVAEALMKKGLDVTFVTRHVGIGHQLDGAFMTSPTLGRFAHDRFTLFSRSRVMSIEENTAVIAPVYLVEGSNQGRKVVPADTVVLVTYNRPNRELAVALEGGPVPIHVIGDALTPRDLEVSIREGYRIGAAI